MEERIYKPGELIGYYQVLDHLGTGGFCCVYEVKALPIPKPANVALILLLLGCVIPAVAKVAGLSVKLSRVGELAGRIERLSSAYEQLAQQLLPHALKTPPLTQLALNGLKMPEKPEPNWLVPGPDGQCHDPETGEKLEAAVLRGACWQAFPKVDPDKPCVNVKEIGIGIYDAPPEAPVELKSSCFLPYQIKRKPQSIVPGSR